MRAPGLIVLCISQVLQARRVLFDSGRPLEVYEDWMNGTAKTWFANHGEDVPRSLDLKDGAHVWVYLRRVSDYVSPKVGVVSGRKAKTTGTGIYDVLSITPGLRKKKGQQVIEQVGGHAGLAVTSTATHNSGCAQVMADGKKAIDHAERLKWVAQKFERSWRRDGGFPVDIEHLNITVWVHMVLLWVCADGPMLESDEKMMGNKNPNWYPFKHLVSTHVSGKGKSKYSTQPLTLNLHAKPKTHAAAMKAARAVEAGHADARDHGVHGVSAFSILPWCLLPHSCAAAANPAPWLLLVWPGTMSYLPSRSTAPISPRASDATGSCRYHCLLFKQLEFDHIVKGIILQLIKLAIAGMSKAQRQAFRTRLMDTRRPRGFALTQDWCAGKDFKASTSGGKIHVTLQWFLHCSWADIAGLLTPVSEQLWCATPVAASAVHRPGH
jgi:hypothetical protein